MSTGLVISQRFLIPYLRRHGVSHRGLLSFKASPTCITTQSPFLKSSRSAHKRDRPMERRALRRRSLTLDRRCHDRVSCCTRAYCSVLLPQISQLWLQLVIQAVVGLFLLRLYCERQEFLSGLFRGLDPSG